MAHAVIVDRMRLLIVPLLSVIAACGSEPVGVVDSLDSPQGGVCTNGFDQPEDDGACVFRGHTFEVDQHGTACAIGSRFELLWVSNGETVVFGLHKPVAFQSPAASWLFAATVDGETAAELFAWAPLGGEAQPLDRGRFDLSGLSSSPVRGWTRVRGVFGEPAPFEIKGCAVEFFANVNPNDPALFERFDVDTDPKTADLQAAAREFLALF